MYIYVYVYPYTRLLSSIAPSTSFSPLTLFYPSSPYFASLKRSAMLRNGNRLTPPPFPTRQRPRKSTQLLTFQPLRRHSPSAFAFDEPLRSLPISLSLLLIFTRHFRWRESGESWMDFFRISPGKSFFSFVMRKRRGEKRRGSMDLPSKIGVFSNGRPNAASSSLFSSCVASWPDCWLREDLINERARGGGKRKTGMERKRTRFQFFPEEEKRRIRVFR